MVKIQIYQIIIFSKINLKLFQYKKHHQMEAVILVLVF